MKDARALFSDCMDRKSLNGKIWEQIQERRHIKNFFRGGNESESIVDSNWIGNINKDPLWTKIS